MRLTRFYLDSNIENNNVSSESYLATTIILQWWSMQVINNEMNYDGHNAIN